MNNTTVTEDLLRTASRFWLMKSEPGECSIDDALAAPGRRVSWFGIRIYQARNFMRDDMTIGDAVLFYHSSCAKPGIAGIARIASDVYPDELQFDPESEYYDPKSTKENPRWLTLDVEALFKCPVVEIEANVCLLPFLLKDDEKYGDKEPFRTYKGMKYQGGVSDHLPIYADFELILY